MRALHKSLLVLLVACAPAPEPPSPTAVLAEVGAALHALELDDKPWLQIYAEVEERRFPDLRPERAEERSATARRLLERLDGLDSGELELEDWITAESLRRDLELVAEEARFYWHGFQLAPYSFSHLGAHALLGDPYLESEEEARGFLDGLDDYLVFLEQLRTRLAGQLERGIVMPRPVVAAAVEAWRARAEDPSTVFNALAAESPAGFGSPPEVVEPYREKLVQRVRRDVAPAWRRLIDYLEGPYLDAAPEEGGLARLPDGPEYYAYLVRLSVTADMPPEEIHALGLRRLEETAKRMEEVRERLGFAGTAAEFHRELENDPRFYARTPEEVEARLSAYVAAIEPRIEELFSRRPRAPYRIARLESHLEADMTYGFYLPPSPADDRGTYFYNGSSLDERSMIGAAALIYHELVPGHHFQQALLLENEALTPYRRDAWHDAFVEGWGKYATLLAAELGMYEDPYDLYGWLSEESFYYARLVVDTGLNHHGWTRAEASAFMRANTLASPTEIDTEILRYSTDLPAQALAYALGSEKLVELRERARAELGEDFDVRRFHDAVLGHGSMPLAVLEGRIDRFIAEERGRQRSLP